MHSDEVIPMAKRYLESLPRRFTFELQVEVLDKAGLLFKCSRNQYPKFRTLQDVAEMRNELLIAKMEILEGQKMSCMGKDERRMSEVEITADKRNEEAMQEVMKKAIDVPRKIGKAGTLLCDEIRRMRNQEIIADLMREQRRNVGRERRVRDSVFVPLHKD